MSKYDSHGWLVEYIEYSIVHVSQGCIQFHSGELLVS